MTLQVIITDVETSESGECTVAEGDYVVICAAPCYLDGVQAYPTTGTHVVTIKGRTKP